MFRLRQGLNVIIDFATFARALLSVGRYNLETFQFRQEPWSMPVPVINLAQMRAWEKATWAAGQTEDEVIRRVGKRVARRARRMTRAGDTIVIFAGKGHNGEDATAAKLYLDSRKVKLVELLLPASDLI